MASASASDPVGECSRKEVPQAAGSAKCGPGDSAASEQLNADFGTVAVEHASSMKWAPSPSPAVYRKRLELSGPKECGRVTSVVRYEPKSNFHEHGHPDGEEIFVLSGVFSDDSGDYPGAEIFVKLRQYSGQDREHIVSHPLQPDGTPSAEGWSDATDFSLCRLSAPAAPAAAGAPAAAARAFTLYTSPSYPESIRLLQVPAQSSLTPTHLEECDSRFAGAELFVVHGAVTVQQTDGVAVWKLLQRSWLRLPSVLACFSLANAAESDAFVYLKQNHLPNEAVA